MGDSRGYGGGTDGLLDDRLLLECVERRWVRQNPFESAPCVASSPAQSQRAWFSPLKTLPELLGAKLIAPADALLRVLRVQVRDEVVVAHCGGTDDVSSGIPTLSGERYTLRSPELQPCYRYLHIAAEGNQPAADSPSETLE